MMKLILLLLIPFLTLAQHPKKKDYLVTLNTEFGTMHIVLFEDTPLHRANYIKLIDAHYFDGLLFHRVIPRFMIQSGDPTSRTAVAGQALGDTDNGTLIPAEFRPNRFHYKGVMAAARDDRPDKASSDSQFYLVQGRVWTDSTLDAQLLRGQKRGGGRTPTDAQRQVYKTLGGTPHLDGGYTVFGEVIDNQAVIDSIAKQPRNPADRPLTDRKLTMSGIWVRKKKITKLYGYRYE
jgi:cyclophilin family peptidyl-prolyl cis-trans isomerase